MYSQAQPFGMFQQPCCYQQPSFYSMMMPQAMPMQMSQSVAPVQVQQLSSLEINPELIRERDSIKQQLTELETKYNVDIEELKANLLAESERILQRELTNQAKQYDEQIVQMDQQIQQQITQIQQLERVNVEVKAQNFEILQKLGKKKEKIQYLKEEISQMKDYYEKKIIETENYWRQKLNQELGKLEKDLNQRFNVEKQTLETQVRSQKARIQSLEERNKEQQREIDRLRDLLSQKTSEIEELKSQLSISQNRIQIQHEVERPAPQSPTQTRNLQNQIETLKRELLAKDEKLKKKKNKVQQVIVPQYIQSPPQQVIIEKPVERIVEVEKIVPVERLVCQPQPVYKQPIIVQAATQNVNDEELEELEEQIIKQRKTIQTLTAQLNAQNQDYDQLLHERNQLKQNLDIMIQRFKDQEDQIIRQKTREIADKVYNMNRPQAKNDNITIVRAGDKKGPTVVRK